MPAIHTSLLARAEERNWAYRNPGVTLVFAIVGVVGIGLIALWIYKRMLKRRSQKPDN
ncbi:hypothetical protein G6O67_008631 [Ophiocordyceps sinensis]|uniref:Uncharacterized protein n=2 Tax=Ophiocordyceps sinensis TaxID=72228 RepID=A0A8H4PIB2_9HYPO|nr:hypothetical protein OCS_04583 [Ophiocordyceps sinensis CO18]KAF4504008.1 hypothetical protein G6O67_008631 [Ophiocordyceps sinensis]